MREVVWGLSVYPVLQVSVTERKTPEPPPWGFTSPARVSRDRKRKSRPRSRRPPPLPSLLGRRGHGHVRRRRTLSVQVGFALKGRVAPRARCAPDPSRRTAIRHRPIHRRRSLRRDFRPSPVHETGPPPEHLTRRVLTGPADTLRLGPCTSPVCALDNGTPLSSSIVNVIDFCNNLKNFLFWFFLLKIFISVMDFEFKINRTSDHHLHPTFPISVQNSGRTGE